MPRPSLAARLFRVVVLAALFVGTLAGAFYGYRYLKETRPEVARRPPVEREWTVSTVVADYTDHRPELTTYGTTTAARKVDLRALVSGEIVSVAPELREGGIVTKGQELLEIDAFDYEGAVVEARANLAEARARLAEIEAKIELEVDALELARTQLELAERDLKRAEDLSERGAVSTKTVDDRRIAVNQRKEAVSQRENQQAIDRARGDQQEAAIERLEWKQRQAERNLANTTLRAPFDAYVANAAAETGRLVGINDAVATLIDANRLDIRFVLSDSEFGRIADDAGSVVGRDVQVTWYAGEEPRRFSATVDRVTPEIEAARGGVEVFASIGADDLRGAALLPRPGAFVQVEIADRTYRDAARVPATALYGTNTVYVVEEGRLRAREVTVLGRAGSDLLLRGNLAEGDRVVTTRITEAGEGLKVRDDSAPPAEDDASGNETSQRGGQRTSAADSRATTR
ncbi:efflux RND transporter periplasmic adaptor subunit [Tepidamorphus sp. 3E244]|uniref:efflux RND transporter periplasmic adaptor subunit n=1 Tax=Tepidamorphus sp. 3E244 TaxID=3385498 RepID=UPI0038FCBB96